MLLANVWKQVRKGPKVGDSVKLVTLRRRKRKHLIQRKMGGTVKFSAGLNFAYYVYNKEPLFRWRSYLYIRPWNKETSGRRWEEGEGKRRCAARRGPLSTRRRSREEAHRLLQTFASVVGAKTSHLRACYGRKREREGEWSEADERRASRDTFVAALIEKPLSLFHRDNGSRNVL